MLKKVGGINTLNHITYILQGKCVKHLAVVATNHRTVEKAISNLPPDSERAKQITNSIATIIAKDLCPYSV